jgi:YaiO family outer membrane protein
MTAHSRSANARLHAMVGALLVVLQVGALFTVHGGANAGVDGDSQSTENRFYIAREAARSGNYEVAKQEYEALMLAYPDDVDYLFGYAQVLFWTEDYRSAIQVLERARGIAPDYEDIWKLEYRARQALDGLSNAGSVREFKRQATANFPDAEWLNPEPMRDSRRYHWSVSVDRDFLDNDTPDWHQLGVYFGRYFTNSTVVSATAISSRRFGQTDTQFGAGASIGMFSDWFGTLGIAISSSPNFLPARDFNLGLSRKFGRGWIAGARWRKRDYAATTVDAFGLTAERYFGRFRAAYFLDQASLDGERALAHRLTGSYYGDSGIHLNVITAFGEEVEAIVPGEVLRSDFWSMAITGRHPMNDRLAFHWRIGTHQQGDLYRRNSLGVSISGDF